VVVEPGQRVTFTHTITASSDAELTPGFFVMRGDKAVVDTTYARMRGHALPLRAGESASVTWSLAFNLPAGVYEIGYHVGDIGGGYHDHQSRGVIVTVGDDPRVRGDAYVGLQLEERRGERALDRVTVTAGSLP
jgi:hypothetical protein